MERMPAATTVRTPGLPFSWRVTGQYLPILAMALAAFLIVRNLAGGGASTPPPATVDAGHSERLAANITFFEQRVVETRDSLSYNRLTSLYLQRQRETGDATDISRAETSASKSLEAAPGAYAGLVNLGFVRIAQHDFEGALSVAAAAIARFPNNPDAYAVRGDALLALGRYDEAGADYRLLLEKLPGAAAFSRNATLAEVRGSTGVAEQFWQAAIDSDQHEAPEASAWARVQLGNLRLSTGDLPGAKKQYETALRVFPGYGAAEAGLGRVAVARGDEDEAIARFEAAVERLPLPEYVATLGDLLVLAGRPVEAERQFALVRAIGQLYTSSGVRNDLTLILFEADHGGDTVKVVADARAAYEARPSLGAADVYGWALYRAGRLEEARARADEALRLGTNDPQYLFHAAVIAEAQGDIARAREHATRLQGLNTHFSIQHEQQIADLQRRLGMK